VVGVVCVVGRGWGAAAGARIVRMYTGKGRRGELIGWWHIQHKEMVPRCSHTHIDATNDARMAQPHHGAPAVGALPALVHSGGVAPSVLRRVRSAPRSTSSAYTSS
jgi:hypothetical protein